MENNVKDFLNRVAGPSGPGIKSAGLLIFFFLVINTFSLFFLSCYNLDSPLDPAAVSYQGFHSVDSLEALKGHIPAAESNSLLDSLVLSRVIGADLYSFEIAILDDFIDPVLSAAAESNILAVTEEYPDLEFINGSLYYWRGRARVGGNFGPWTDPVPFIYGYRIGDPGPAGGLIFYVKEDYTGGWRYLEAAPKKTEWRNKPWGGQDDYHMGTSPDIGAGLENTAKIVEVFGDQEPHRSRSDYAARLCAALVHGGYEDWFLPSIDELQEIYLNLHLHNPPLGDFSRDTYWSSSDEPVTQIWNDEGSFYLSLALETIFGYGGAVSNGHKTDTGRVRAVRRF